MGSSGMKRKGRKHQPKVGSPAEDRYALHKERQAVEENFGIRPGSGFGRIFGIVVVVGAVVAIIALIALN